MNAKRSILPLLLAAAMVAPPPAGAQVVLRRGRVLVTRALPQVKEPAETAADGLGAPRLVPVKPPLGTPRDNGDNATTPVVNWLNGEKLAGKWISAGDGDVTWESPVFPEPVTLSLDVLRSLEQPLPAEASSEPFRFVLRDGCHVYGTVTALDAAGWHVRSAKHGDFVIAADQLVSMQRLKEAGIRFSGPAGLRGWEAGDTKGGAPTKWYMAGAGAIATPTWDRSIFVPVETADKCQMEISLRSSVRPQFIIEWVSPPNQKISLETWDDEVVIVQGSQFASSVKRLKTTDRELHIRLCWDRASGECTAYSADGKLLSRCPKPEVPPPALSQKRAGLVIRNKARDCYLDLLTVRDWNGSAPAAVPEKSAWIETADGRIIAGTPASATDNAVTLQTPEGTAVEVPLAELVMLHAAPMEPAPAPAASKDAAKPDAKPAPPPQTSTEFWFADGTLLKGRLLSANSGSANIQADFAASPLVCKLAECCLIALPAPAKAPEPASLDELDRLATGGVTLHGTMTAEDDPLPRFQLVGAKAAVRLARTNDLVVARAQRADSPLPPRPEALLHVRGDNIIPVRIDQVSRNGIEFHSDIVTASSLPVGAVHALQTATPEVNPKGFEDPGWQQISGPASELKFSGEKVVLFPGTSFGHPNMLQGDEINFRIHNEYGSGVVRVRLFSAGTERNSPSTNLLLAHWGSEVYAGLETEEGQINERGELHVEEDHADIRISLQPRVIEVLANGVSLARVPVGTQKRSGLGLIFEPASLWGNQVYQVGISHFSLRPAPWQATVPSIQPEARTQALLVPRFRRDDPPRHILLANNGDLLRGEIEGFAAGHYTFRSGLETLQIPVNRVAAAIWLEPPAKPEDKPAPAATVPAPAGPLTWLELANGGRISLELERFGKEGVTGRHPLLGMCKIPVALVHSLQTADLPVSPAMMALRDWRLQLTPDPVLPDGGGDQSPMVGKDAPDFKLASLTLGETAFANLKGRVVVLDFWATWCGPCVKSMPDLIAAMSEFSADEVAFFGVNQGEPPDNIKTFLEARGWHLNVLLDTDQKTGRDYGVDGIPHTVIIGRDGKIAWVKTGYTPEGARETAATVRKLLGKGGATAP